MDISALKKRFIEIYGGDEKGIRAFTSPGRVNLIGEHIDYNGGYVFPMALELSATALVRENADGLVRIAASDLDARVTIDPMGDLEKYKALEWGDYQAGVIDELIKAGYAITGLDMLFHDTIPHGGGLSSSAAIEVCTALAFATYSNEKRGIESNIDLVELSLLSQRAENLFVGMGCGIMDQFSSAMGKRERAILLNCDTLEYEYVPLELGEYTVVIANTNKKRALVDSKYNERRAECDEAFGILKRTLPDIRFLCDLTPEQFRQNDALIASDAVRKRAEHAVMENDRVFRAVKTLRDNDIEQFGRLLNEGHRSLRDLYEVTGKELDAMFEAALKAQGVAGSRMTGAGFGGCTVSVVKKDCVEAFIEFVGGEYYKKTGLTPSFFVTGAGDGARELTI